MTKAELALIGKTLADTLHNSETKRRNLGDHNDTMHVRTGVLSVKSDLYVLVTAGHMSHQKFNILENAFNKRLDELEPLSVKREVLNTVTGA